jgi:hypothetical protein
VIERAICDASASTIWRWLHDDALKPWQQRCWVYMRDPQFAEKASVALDLYQRIFEGRRLHPDEYVICADEKSQLQALGRRHETLCMAPAGRSSCCVGVSERFSRSRGLGPWCAAAAKPRESGRLWSTISEGGLRAGEHEQHPTQDWAAGEPGGGTR